MKKRFLFYFIFLFSFSVFSLDETIRGEELFRRYIKIYEGLGVPNAGPSVLI